MENVLFVDDEPFILKAIERLLRNSSYTKYFANSGEEALSIMEKVTISVIVTDIQMDKIDGISLLKEVKKLYPHTIKVAFSGYTDKNQLLSCINNGEVFKYVTKPLNIEELKKVIKDSLNQYILNISHYKNIENFQENLFEILEKFKVIKHQFLEDRDTFNKSSLQYPSKIMTYFRKFI